jgi:hypothetical protein
MSNGSEDEVKQALGIDSWRNLSKDGVMRLVAMMPEMSKDVALKIAEQFPDFKMLATETLNAVSEQLKNVLKHNDKSQKRAQKAFQTAQEAYIHELDRDLSSEERRDLYERILETAIKVDAKDDRNKQFILNALKVIGATIVAVLVAAVAFVGGRGKLDA